MNAIHMTSCIDYKYTKHLHPLICKHMQMVEKLTPVQASDAKRKAAINRSINMSRQTEDGLQVTIPSWLLVSSFAAASNLMASLKLKFLLVDI